MTAPEVRSTALLIAGMSLAAVFGVAFGSLLGWLTTHHMVTAIILGSGVLFGVPLGVALIAHLIIRRRGA